MFMITIIKIIKLLIREFAKFDRGYPDGSTVDSEGFYGAVVGVVHA